MKIWLGKHPRVALYSISALLFLCIIFCILLVLTAKQLRLNGAAQEEQYFTLCRSHAERGLALLEQNVMDGKTAHAILSAAEYLRLCGEKGLAAAQILYDNGVAILETGKPAEEITELLKSLIRR